MMIDFSTLLIPEIFMACAAMVLLVGGVYRAETAGAGFIFQMAIVVMLLTACLLVMLPNEKTTLLGGLFVWDSYAVFMKVLVLLAASVVLLVSLDYSQDTGISKGKDVPHERLRFEYAVLVLLSVTGMMVMISANDLMSLYMGLELQSLALYVLTTIERKQTTHSVECLENSSEAGLKYFMLGALSSGILLYGASMIYGFAGTTNFSTLSALYQHGVEAPVGVTLGMVLVLVGLCFKISAAPFHMWAPDVYQGAPKPVTTFFASAPKIAAIALFVRVVMQPFGGMVFEWQQVVMFAAVASMAVGALGALRQTNIKRLMAYSSIAHMGFVLVGIAAASPEGVHGVLVYSALYVVMSLGTFGIILLMKKDKDHVEAIDDLAGIARKHPFYAAMLAILMLSMAGIPPLAGFFGKLFVFKAAVESGLYGLAVIGVMASVVGAYYYLRIVKVMYFDDLKPAPYSVFDQPISGTMKLVVAAAGIFNLAFCLFPSALLRIADEAAKSLFL